MNITRGRRRLVLAGLGLLVVGIVYKGWGVFPSWPRAPADEELRERFDTHLRDFEELRDILLSLPQDRLWFSQDQIGGSLLGARKHAFLRHEGQWHEWESRRPLTIAAVLQTLGVSPDRHGRIMELVNTVDGGSARKIASPDGMEVEVGTWGGAGIWGVVKAIVFIDPAPGRNIVQNTDSDAWDGTVYATLGRRGWFIRATR